MSGRSHLAVVVAGTVAVFSLAGCPDTPGGNSKSPIRRFNGQVVGTDIASCGPSALDSGYAKCADKCLNTSYKCDYRIDVQIDSGTFESIRDATFPEWKACQVDKDHPKRWPDCRVAA